MPPVRFEPTVPASEQPQTDALDRVATGMSSNDTNRYRYIKNMGLSRNVDFSQQKKFILLVPFGPSSP